MDSNPTTGTGEHRRPCPSPAAFQPVWKREHTHLAYWLGPWKLANPGFNLLVTREYVPRPLAGLEDLGPLCQQTPEDAEGYLLFAHRAQGHWPRRARAGQWLCYTAQTYERHMADLTLGVEAYWARFSSKTRFNLKRNVKLLTKAAGGTLDWRRYTTAAEAAEFHRLALPLSMRTYQHKLFQGGLPDSAVFLDHMAAAAERGDVRAYLLFMQGEVIAYLYLVAENGILAYSYVGHDAGRAQWSPGSVLMTLAMEDVQAEGRFRWMDFGSGHGQHKSVFSTEAVPVAHVYLLPPTLRNRWIVWTHDLLARFSSALTAFLHQHDLHSRLKRLVRRMASTSPGQTP